MIADYREFDALVEKHITEFPGLTSWEIARALRTVTGEATVAKTRVERSLHRLLAAGKARSRYIAAAVPGGRKCTWEAASNDT